MEALRFPSPTPAERALRADALETAFRLGDLRAGERLAAILEAEPETRRDARRVLERILRQDPGRVDALRLLLRVTDALGDRAAALSVASVLSLFDPGGSAAPPGVVRAHPDAQP